MTERTEEFEIRGEAPDPAGTGLKGSTAGIDLTKTALGHPRIRWRDRIATADVYAAGDELMVHFYCPNCTHALRVTSSHKEMRYSRGDDRISIAPMRCTWPGCGFHARVENNVFITM